VGREKEAPRKIPKATAKSLSLAKIWTVALRGWLLASVTQSKAYRRGGENQGVWCLALKALLPAMSACSRTDGARNELWELGTLLTAGLGHWPLGTPQEKRVWVARKKRGCCLLNDPFPESHIVPSTPGSLIKCTLNHTTRRAPPPATPPHNLER
jgi:hypothetical protein